MTKDMKNITQEYIFQTIDTLQYIRFMHSSVYYSPSAFCPNRNPVILRPLCLRRQDVTQRTSKLSLDPISKHDCGIYWMQSTRCSRSSGLQQQTWIIKHDLLRTTANTYANRMKLFLRHSLCRCVSFQKLVHDECEHILLLFVLCLHGCIVS